MSETLTRPHRFSDPIGFPPAGVRQLMLGEKSVVMASASESEVTSDFDRVRHGLFTCYLLKGLQGEAECYHHVFVRLNALQDRLA